MDADSLGVLTCALVAAVLLVVYFVASHRERGRSPHYAQEVYLYRVEHSAPGEPSPDPAAVAVAHRAALATQAQVALYAAAGGSARGRGQVAGGACVGLTPAAKGPLAVTAGAPAGCGAWLYGAKPRRGSPGVAPFSDGLWFQPAGARAPRPAGPAGKAGGRL
jgi:hypothetical protein